jgi:hypothetical protein
MNTTSTDHELVGARLRVTYQPATQDLVNGSLHFDEPETVTFTVERANDHRAVGEADDGRMVAASIRGGNKTVRARAADRDEGAYRQHLGYRRGVEVLDA